MYYIHEYDKLCYFIAHFFVFFYFLEDRGAIFDRRQGDAWGSLFGQHG